MQDGSADIYAENILEHYRHPHHKEEIKNPSIEHEEANHACGDVISIQIELKNGNIDSIGWDGTGCAISQAGMSILSEELIGMKTEDVLALKKDDIHIMLGIPIGPRRFKCALLCLHTVKNALRKIDGLEPQGWLDTVEIDED